MKVLFRSKSILILTALVTMMVIALPVAISAFSLHLVPAARAAASTPSRVSCTSGSAFCAEVYDSEKVFGEGKYVGHDEPSNLFYSNVPGSGNQMRYDLTLPKDPPATPLSTGKSFNFQLHPAFWFGMAMCDTQSFPELLSTCTPDSDKNIVDPAISPRHPGTAFMELQFYAPGWVQQFTGSSCNGTQWCAALNIDSLSQNPVNGQSLNSTCSSKILGGVEYINFAYLTKNGIPQAAPNPVQFNPSNQTPDPKKVLFMNSGDHVVVTLHDTGSGLLTEIQDLTTGISGFMTSSAANGFGQVKFDPTGTSCVNLPYDFHPMYSTSSELTRVPWTAHSYNIAFSDEIGHWDYCSNVDAPTGTCTANEGIKHDQEATDADDLGCFPASASTRIPLAGCTFTNTGFDGVPYQPVWPDGNTALHPTAIRFTSPLTGSNYNVNYSRTAFEADLPRIELSTCNRGTGAGCTLIPVTDDGSPAAFYPFFSITNVGGQCTWQLGNHIPGSINDFHQNQQYGTLLNLTYTNGKGTIGLFEDFRQVFSHNPCSAGN